MRTESSKNTVINLRQLNVAVLWQMYSSKLTRNNHTRLHSNLRPSTRECVHLVTRGHSQSRDKDGDHTMRKSKSPCCTQTSWLCVLWNQLLPIEV